MRQAWERACTDKLVEAVSVSSAAAVSTFAQPEMGVRLVVRGGDLTFLGREQDLYGTVELMASWFEVKVHCRARGAPRRSAC